MVKVILCAFITFSSAYGHLPQWSDNTKENLDLAYQIAKRLLDKSKGLDSEVFDGVIKGIRTSFLLKNESSSIDRINHYKKINTLTNSTSSFDRTLFTFLSDGTISIITDDYKTYSLELRGYETRKKVKFILKQLNTSESSLKKKDDFSEDIEGKFGISIVIPTFNRISECSSCITMLKSRIAAPKDQWEVIVVDDGCTDGTGNYFTELFKNVGFENFRVIYTDKKPGVYRNAGWPENSGVKAAKFSHISLCDCDVYHLMDPVSPSLNVLKDDKSALIVGNLHEVNMDGVRYRLIDLPWNEGSEPGWLVIRKKFFIEIGGNSEQLTKWGYEDTDLLNRLLSLGLKKKRLDSIISVFGFERKTDHKSNTQLLLNNNMRILESDPDIIRNKDNPNWGIFFESPLVAQIEPNFSATN